MARDESFPFDWNDYYTDNLERIDLEGKEVVVEDIDYSMADVKTLRSGRSRTLRCVRNVAGSAVLPKRVVKSYAGGTGVELLGQIDGYSTAGTDPVAGVVNEWLPAAGVPDDALFFIVVDGPAKCTTGASGDTNISAGTYVKPTTDGKVVDQVRAEDDADIFTEIQGRVGRAVAAVNAADTDFLVLVNLG